MPMNFTFVVHALAVPVSQIKNVVCREKISLLSCPGKNGGSLK
jgi:hypothetical protein